MTFCVVAADPGRQALGIALASGAPAAGARCAHLRPGSGAAVSQANTDPALAHRLLDSLGRGPEAALGELAGTPLLATRQLAVVDAAGRAAIHDGAESAPLREGRVGKGYACLGNHLAAVGVAAAMAATFEATPVDAPMELRLMAALRAGRDAGGDKAGHVSAVLLVAEGSARPRTDLRVDRAAKDSVEELDELARLWVDLLPYYARRPHDPTLGDWRDFLAREGKR